MRFQYLFIVLCTMTACFHPPEIQPNIPSSESGSASSSSIVIIPKKKNIAPPTVTIDWVSPNTADINIKNIGGKIEVKVRINSPQPINLDQIDILINGQPSGNKANEVSLMKRAEFKDQVLTAQVPINDGSNTVQIVVSTAADQRYIAERTIIKNPSGIKVETGSVVASNTRIAWTQPDVFSLKENEMFNTKTQEIEVKFNITSPDPVDKSNIKILVNKVYRQPSLNAVLLGSAGNYSFRDIITLNENIPINEISLKVDARSGASESQKLRVNFSPSRPNLYILSVGTKTNLKYTTKDARDFANLFYAQGKDAFRLFTTVLIDTLIGKAATANEIRGSIEAIKTKFRTGVIMEDDVVIIFISSHGFLESDGLRIQGDDFDPNLVKKTSVSYPNDILAELDQLPCKKLLFLDACHGAGAKAAVPEAINNAAKDLKNTKKGLAIFASSSKTEESHEDVTWQNGAFTECLIKGLKEGTADVNKNGIVTLSELEKFVTAEVPPMVKKVKNKEQHPVLTRNELGDIPIYIIKK